MTSTTNLQPIILGIDPGTRFMGFVVLRGTTLLDYGVHTLRNGRRPYDLLGHARSHVLASIRDHQPEVVAVEEPLLLPTRRAALVSAIAQELQERARELGVRVVELSPRRVREMVVRNPHATKIDVAEAIVRQGFGELAALVPKRPARAALGLAEKDRYWLHMFDSLAVAHACAMQDTAVPQLVAPRNPEEQKGNGETAIHIQQRS